MADPDLFLSGANAWEQGNYPLAYYLGEQGIRSKIESVPSYRIREARIRSQSFIEGQSLLDALKDHLYYFQDFEPVESLFFSLQKRLPLCAQTEVFRVFYQEVSSWFQALHNFDPDSGDWREIQKVCRQILTHFPHQSHSREILLLVEQALELDVFLESLCILKEKTANAKEDEELLHVPAQISISLPSPHPFLQSRIDKIKSLQEEILQKLLHHILYEADEDQKKGLYEQAEYRLQLMLIALQEAGWTPSLDLSSERDKVRERKVQFTTLLALFQQAEQERRFSECAVHLTQLIAMAPKHGESQEAQKRVNDKQKQAQFFRQNCEKWKAERNRKTLRSHLLQEGVQLLPVEEYNTWLTWADEVKRKKRRRRMVAFVLFLLLSTGVTVLYFQVIIPIWEQVTDAFQSPISDRTDQEDRPLSGSNFDAIRLDPPKEISAGGTLHVYLDRTVIREDVILEARLLPGGNWKPESNGMIEFSNISSKYGSERTVEVRITQVDTGIYQVNSYLLLIRE